MFQTWCILLYVKIGKAAIIQITKELVITTHHKTHNYAVIMAGGSGSRLWPMSRRNSPKQLQALFDSQKTMIQLMYDLLRELFPADHIFVQTTGKYAHEVEKQLAEMPAENIFQEPEQRDTAPAFGFASAALLERDPEAIIGIFYSDHIINSPLEFNKAVRTAYLAAVDYPEFISMIGVKPTYAHTGLGYIKIRNQAKSYPEGEAFYVDKFIEKPDLETAEQFTKSWEYFWNTGYKIGRASQFFNLIEGIDPSMAKTLRKISELMGDSKNDGEIKKLYSSLQKVSFEYLVTEHSEKLLIIPSDIAWSDIGDWKTLHGMLADLNDHDVITKGNQVSVDCHNSLIYSGDRLIATLGLNNIIVVDTGDVVLVADREKVLDMKELIDELKKQNRHTYL